MMELPPGWTDTSLGEVIELRYGKSLTEKDRLPGDFGVYGSNGLVGSHITSITDAPAIVVGRKGSIGEVHFSERACFPIDTTYFVDRFDCAVPRFVLHLLGHLPLRKMNRASAVPGLNREDAYRLPIALPPLPEQRRIVAKIDSLLAKSRRTRDHLDHIPRLVDKYKQAILAAAFRGELTKDWRSESNRLGWKTSTIGDVARIASGQTPKGIEAALASDGDLPWFKVSSMNETGNLDGLCSSQFRLSRQKADALGLRIFQAGSMAFPKRGGAIATNKKRRLLVEGALDLNLMVLTARTVSPDFLWWWLQGLDLATISNGSNVPQINNGDIAPLVIEVPPIDEQNEIARRVQHAIAWISRLASETTKARKLINHLDQAVLAKAFRGELVPQHPNDEPARVLLERIKAERRERRRRTKAET
jgi:type I restriction enzyme S subunit